jgi:YggT family protein
MVSFLYLIDTVLEIYLWCVIIGVVMSWLIAFGVVNTYNRFVATVNDFLRRITEPALAPMRRYLPQLGGIDISPLVLILLIVFVRNLLREYFV